MGKLVDSMNSHINLYFLFICLSMSTNLTAQRFERNYKSFSDTVFEIGDVLRMSDVQFSMSGGYKLLERSHDSLKYVFDFINRNNKYTYEIGSHSDSRDSDEKNMKLTQVGVRGIRTYLVDSLKADESSIQFKGYGETELIYSDEYINRFTDKYEREKLHQINRRYELKILDIVPTVTREFIMGAWKADYDDSENATIGIYEDSIFNVEHFSTFGYILRGDSIIIDFGDMKSRSKVKFLDEDTMIWIEGDIKTTYVRFKD